MTTPSWTMASPSTGTGRPLTTARRGTTWAGVGRASQVTAASATTGTRATRAPRRVVRVMVIAASATASICDDGARPCPHTLHRRDENSSCAVPRPGARPAGPFIARPRRWALPGASVRAGGGPSSPGRCGRTRSGCGGGTTRSPGAPRGPTTRRRRGSPRARRPRRSRRKRPETAPARRACGTSSTPRGRPGAPRGSGRPAPRRLCGSHWRRPPHVDEAGLRQPPPQVLFQAGETVPGRLHGGVEVSEGVVAEGDPPGQVVDIGGDREGGGFAGDRRVKGVHHFGRPPGVPRHHRPIVGAGRVGHGEVPAEDRAFLGEPPVGREPGHLGEGPVFEHAPHEAPPPAARGTGGAREKPRGREGRRPREEPPAAQGRAGPREVRVVIGSWHDGAARDKGGPAHGGTRPGSGTPSAHRAHVDPGGAPVLVYGLDRPGPAGDGRGGGPGDV